jgi:hypothetical protein
MNRTYHPESWSQQARAIADSIFNQVIYYTYEYPERWTDKDTPEKWATEFFQTYYRHPLIRQRAAARYGRLLREYKKKKNIK